MSTTQSPLELLLSYQQRVLKIRADMPVVRNEREEWSGLAFRLGEHVLITAMSDVEEIVDVPDCANVPNTKAWFWGVGNVRGSLVAVTDLYGFVFGRERQSSSTARVLTCASGDSSAGIVVDEILGLRRFFVDEQNEHTATLPEMLGHYVERAFERDDQRYPVFELRQFVNSSEFLHVVR